MEETTEQKPSVSVTPTMLSQALAHWSSLNPQVKVLLVAAIGAAGSLSIPQAQAWIVSNLGQHPKLTAWATSLIFIVGLYQKPYVQSLMDAVLQVKQTSPTTAQVEVVDPNATK
jgi:hypothetical protein